MKIAANHRLALLLLTGFAVASQVGIAQVFPPVLSYQGVLRNDNGTAVNDGIHQLKFTFYPSEISVKPDWSETKTVTTANGVFSTHLGDVTPFPDHTTFNAAIWLEVELVFLDGNVVLGPRTMLTPSPYAMWAYEVENFSISSTKLTSNAVSTVKIADGAVTNAKLAPGAAVETLNGLSGDLQLIGGANVTVTPGTGTLTIDAAAGAGGDDGDWVIDGTHLTHNTSGVVAHGTAAPMQAFAGHSMLQVQASAYPGLALDASNPAFGRWLLFHNGYSKDLLIGYTTGTGGGNNTMIIDDDGQVGIGGLTPTSTLHIKGGNGDLTATYGDFQIADGTHGLRVGVAVDGADEGAVSLRARSLLGTSALNWEIFDHKVARLESETLDFYGDSATRKARFWSGDGMDQGGQLYLYGLGAQTTVELDGYSGNGGSVSLRTEAGTANLDMDATSTGGRILCRNAAGAVTVTIDGQYSDGSGRIQTQVLEITGGSDLSEQFEVSMTDQLTALEPGMVVSIDPQRPGGLQVCSAAYDRKVAGVISGAGGVRPGMLMGQKGSVADGEHPVALTGRVYVRADTSNGPIEPGDLLTSSNVPGHAMKVTDHVRANGAVLGKAMTALPAGQGLVLVLVSLQ